MQDIFTALINTDQNDDEWKDSSVDLGWGAVTEEEAGIEFLIWQLEECIQQNAMFKHLLQQVKAAAED